jgi:DMSO/TMAO reductase YedYZ molybdopterin-dependent catalytic subunit
VSRGSSVAGRRTNLALLALTLIAAVTGALAFGVGGHWVRWAIVPHGVAALGIVALVPWKAVIASRGIRRHRYGSAPAILLAALLAIVMLTGFAHATGLLVSIGPASAMQLHVGSAVASIALLGWHVLVRRTRPRGTDLTRRNLLRAGAVAGGAAVAYGSMELATHLLGLPGADRRSTGSYAKGSLTPAAMPVTQWLNDRVPEIDPAAWSLSIDDADGPRTVAYDDLDAHRERMRAVLDCTGGWWADQEWEGLVLASLLSGVERASSIEVTSVTGYGRRLPTADAGRLLLATRVAGAPLSAGHGFPARLVAPSRRGFWWVKWVDRIALSDVPWWWQAPFPTA